MAEAKEIMYYHFFQGEKHPIVIQYINEPDKDGLLPIETIRGNYMPADHFQHEVLGNFHNRRKFNSWLLEQI